MDEETQSDISSINVWLDSQPNLPEDYIFEWPPLDQKKGSNQAKSTRPHKRQRLMEVSGNAAQSVQQVSSRKLQSSRGDPPPTTPPRHGGSTPQCLASTAPPIAGVDPLEEEDAEQTPKPQSNPPVTIPSLHAQPPNFHIKAPLNRGEASDSADSRGSKTSRSQSPTKPLGALQFAEMPVDPRAWNTTIIPIELKALFKDMERIGQRVGVIPLAVRNKSEAIGETVYELHCAKDGGIDGDIETETNATDKLTGGSGHDLFWIFVSRIHLATHECLNGAAPEPAWNSEVHSSVLRLALEGYWGGNEVWYRDISLARISNKSLVPWNVATGAMQSKMVDYAIVINPSQDFTADASKSLHNHIIEKLRGESGDPSINQTTAEWVRFKPIGVNIETKRGAVGEDEAHVQLGTWISA